jgi:hypothetical protein
MELSPESRKQLRRANTLVRGHILRARCSDDKEEVKEILREALLIYGIWAADAV